MPSMIRIIIVHFLFIQPFCSLLIIYRLISGNVNGHFSFISLYQTIVRAKRVITNAVVVFAQPRTKNVMATSTVVISRMSLKSLAAKAHLVIFKNSDAKTERNAQHNTKNATTEKNAQMAQMKKTAVSNINLITLYIFRCSIIIRILFTIQIVKIDVKL